jgi:hypothetical protein
MNSAQLEQVKLLLESKRDALLDIILDGDHELEIMLMNRQRLELSLVNRALWRLAAGTFGPCEECKRDISFDRFMTLPYTRYCLSCSGKHELPYYSPTAKAREMRRIVSHV